MTGAFSYSGAALASALHGAGRTVRTLTGHPGRAPEGTAVQVHPLDFDDPWAWWRRCRGATTLYNTYWVRFAHRTVDHERAVANSRTLFHAAQRAGVQRIVHVSITHPSSDSPLPYFRGKALVERALAEGDVSYAIVRPAILFGGDGVLLNNIAWLLRRLPVFAIGGRGDYRIRGIHVDDLAQLCLAKAAERGDSVTDAVGPERPTFTELVERRQGGSRQPGPAHPRAGCHRAGVRPRCWGSPCTMYCSRPTSIGPWRPDWPTRMVPPLVPRPSRTGWPSTARPSASATPTSSPGTSLPHRETRVVDHGSGWVPPRPRCSTAVVVIAFGVIATSGVYGSRMAWLLGVAMPLLALSVLCAWLSGRRRPAAFPSPSASPAHVPAGRAVLVSAAVLLGMPVAFAAMLLTTYGVIFVVHGIGLLV